MRALALLAFVALVGVAVWLVLDLASSEDDGAVVDRQALVTRVVDGDTLRARIGRSTERVRLIGIDAPERGECYSRRATALLRTFAQGTVVRILSDSTQPLRDRFGRVLAYVILADGVDAGRMLLARGAAVVFETTTEFERRDEYVDAQAQAARSEAGLHGTCS